jgi:hypothetical protein
LDPRSQKSENRTAIGERTLAAPPASGADDRDDHLGETLMLARSVVPPR